MNYQIDLTGIHCSGCVNLIKLSLEEVGLQDVIVDQEQNKAFFKTGDDSSALASLLNKVFAELETYQYSNLHLIN